MVINFPWTCSIMNICIIWCVPAQILCWQKSYFWDTGQNGPSNWDCRIFKSPISQEQIDETASFFACCYKFTKIKSWLKIPCRAWSKMGVVNLVSRLQNWLPEKWTDRSNNKIFCMLVQIHAHKSCFKIFGVSMVKKGWDQSGNQDSKIDCISKMNRWSKLIFCTLEG